MTVAELLDRMSSEEITEWALHFRAIEAERERQRQEAELDAKMKKGTF